MDIAAIVHRLDVTRARIEAEIDVPGIISITSAARGDGKSLVATGLAHGLAGVGHSVLLIDADAEHADVASPGAAPKLDVLPFDILGYVTPGVRGEPSRLSLAAPGVLATCSLEVVQATFERLRQHFAYTIIDTATLVESGMAFVLASESDGVVIAFKQGRAAHDADREFAKVLKSSKARVLGVVTSQPQAIRSFASADHIAAAPPSPARVRGLDDAAKPGSLGVRLG